MAQKIKSVQIDGLPVKRQNNTTNTTPANARVETGWGVMVATAANNAQETVTFATAFSTAPIVIVGTGGDHASSTTYGDGSLAIKAFYTGSGGISTSGFTAYARTVDATNWTAGNTIFYQWVAIGV